MEALLHIPPKVQSACYNFRMSMKTLIWAGVIVGSTLGGLLPALWGGGVFSFSSVIFSTIGGIAGIWAGYELSQRI